MSRLTDIVAAVETDFPVTVPPVAFKCGARFLTDHQNWPRIVAHVAKASFGPTPGSGYRRDNGTSDQQLLTRVLEVDWEIWAGEYADAESLLHALIVSLHAVLGDSDVSLAFGSEQWLSEDGAKWNGGHCVVLRTTVKIPILTSDRAVVLTAAVPGAGTDTTVADTITMKARVPDVAGTIVGTTTDDDL